MKLNLWYCLETIDYICLGTSKSLLFEWEGIRHWKKYRVKFHFITWIVDISLWLKHTALKSILKYWIYVSKKKKKEKEALLERAPTIFKLMLKCNQFAECYSCHHLACRLFGAKPLSEPIMTCCQWNPWERITLKYELIACQVYLAPNNYLNQRWVLMPHTLAQTSMKKYQHYLFPLTR